MGGELLRIMEAEDSADAIVEEARRRKERAIADALKRRDERLAAIRPDIILPKRPDHRTDGTARIRALGRKNMRKAVRAILEAMHAPN